MSQAPFVSFSRTYIDAVASGRLSFIENDEIRHAPTRHQRRIERVDRLVSSVHDMSYGQLERFLVADTVCSQAGAANWRDVLNIDRAPRRIDFDQLAASREL